MFDSSDRRVFLIANPDKTEASDAMSELRGHADSLVDIVGEFVGHDGQAAIEAKADRIVVFGGDGTLIGVARSLASNQIPLIGVNVGKLGFLTEFSIEELKRDFDRAVCDDRLLSRRTIFQVTTERNGGVRDTHLAINDCVIRAGTPFRVVRLGVSIDGEPLTEFAGDGLIVCTPSGSTAHNLSAGGPIIQSGVDAIVLTPLCAHSLTHKPLVIERDSVVEIVACEVNEGTTAIVDGQVSSLLQPGDRVFIRRFDADFTLVRNPQYAKWHKLKTKLYWGQPPDLV